ncbi:hypothetical protein ACTVLL_25785, partial [Serratia nevei]|uniref:hypothetical protein n=1 Tax=Serratia nevei TaxID=2703794 RepID=UPI003FA6A445
AYGVIAGDNAAVDYVIDEAKWRQPFYGHKKTCFRRLLVKSKVFPDCFGLGVAERYQLCPVIRSAAE